MELLPLITIPFFYFLVALLKPRFQSKISFNICAICLSVALTWIILLTMLSLGQKIDTNLLAILMGMSLTGIMYKLENIYKKNKIRNFWLIRLIIIIGGLYAVFYLLNSEFNKTVFILIASSLLIFLFTFLFQGITHKEVDKENRDKSEIIKRLDNCC